MEYSPSLRPLLSGIAEIYTEISYNNRFYAVDDATRDGEHIHDFYEIYVYLSGDVSFFAEDNVYEVKRGDIIIMAPNEIHRCIYHSDTVHEHFCIWIKELPFTSEALKRDFAKNKLISLSDNERERLIDNCFSFYESSDGEDALRLRAAKSFFDILDVICGKSRDAIEAKSLPSSFSSIVGYISRHYTEPGFSVTDICEKFYISKSTLCRNFQRYFQTTPSGYIEAKRLSEAKKFLLAGQSVQSACLKSGFSDCSYFIMRFRKKFGITPYKYQRDVLT